MLTSARTVSCRCYDELCFYKSLLTNRGLHIHSLIPHHYPDLRHTEITQILYIESVAIAVQSQTIHRQMTMQPYPEGSSVMTASATVDADRISDAGEACLVVQI